MTKDEELAMLRDFVRSLPAGYIQTLLKEADPFIESALRSDIDTGETIGGILESRRELRAELAEIGRQITQERETLARLNQESRTITKRLDEMRGEIRTAARAIGAIH